jgi:parallel beta-helix repeat protein
MKSSRFGRVWSMNFASMRTMAKPQKLWGVALCLLLLAGLMGCSDPTSNKPAPVDPDKPGVALNLTSDHISPDPSGKPYIVDTDWLIDTNRTVTIDPGTTIMFKGLVWVDVPGRIIARGTADNPVTFTSSKLDPDYGQWRGFKLRTVNAGEQSVFEHCVFSYGAYYDTDTTKVDTKLYKGMLCVNNCSPTIERCVVYYNQNNAVYMTGANAAPRVRYNIFTKNDAMAVRADTTVNVAAALGEPGKPDVAYNCVAENSAIPFLMARDTVHYGIAVQRNINLDSVDTFFNLNLPPMMKDPENGDFALSSCSPCVDAGPAGIDPDGDNTRADMGSINYTQVPGELRGLIHELPTTSDGFYRVSCDVRVDSGTTLTIPAGTRIEVSGFYTLQIEGRLMIEGTPSSRVQIYASATDSAGRWAGISLLHGASSQPSVIRNVDFNVYQEFDVTEPGVVFEGCRFFNGFAYGLNLNTGHYADGATSLKNCSFVQCGAYGVQVDSCLAYIRNCVFSGNRGRGITINHGGDLGSIVNCIIQGNGTSGITLETFSSPMIVNNTIAGNAYFGIDHSNNCDPQIKNNIVARNGLRGLYMQLSSQPDISYNDVWGHTSNNGSTDYVPASTVHATDINVDPLFVNYPTDLHLQAGSPARDAGDPDAGYNDGDNTRNDMGAYGGPRAADGIGSSALRASTAPLASK